MKSIILFELQKNNIIYKWLKKNLLKYRMKTTQ